LFKPERFRVSVVVVGGILALGVFVMLGMCLMHTVSVGGVKERSCDR
jgi:hypothetical protein